MPPDAHIDLDALRSEIAGLYDAEDHDVELRHLEFLSDGALQVQTVLLSTPYTHNTAGTIFGNRLFKLADITASIAMLVCVLGHNQQDRPSIYSSTRGGSIDYLQRAAGDISCTLVLPAVVVQSVQAGMQRGSKAVRTLTI